MGQKSRRPPDQAPRSSRWAAGAAASGLALASGLGWSRAAVAREWASSGDVGVFAALHLNARWEIQWGLGIEGRAVFAQQTECETTPQLAFSGAVARAEVVGWKEVRLTLGPVGGRTNGLQGFSADVTGGVTIGAHRFWLVNAGVDGTAFMIPNVRAGLTVGRQFEGMFGGGVRLPPLVPIQSCVIGRPVRRDGGRAPAPGGRAALACGPHDEARSEQTRSRAGQVWLRRACTEWASVPAFCELVEQLEACGAPPELPSSARAAAADELRHAVLSAELASLLSGAGRIELDPPIATVRPTVPGREGLLRLAVESWQDGCVGEGTAAAVAAREAAVSEAPSVSRAQAQIALDEQRHADLAWEVIEWVLRTDPTAARPLLEKAASGALAAHPIDRRVGAEPTATPAQGDLQGFGILDSDGGIAIRAEVEARARARLAARVVAS